MAKRHPLEPGYGWRWLSFSIAGLVATPVLVILASWLLPVSLEHWSHLREHLLWELWQTTLLLLLGVSLGTALLGSGLAWICSQFEFPGAGFLRRALLFPFAVPAYVNAFVYVGLLDYAGPLRTALRDSGLHPAYVPEVRSLSGGIVLLTLSLYPYVYAMCYNAFQTQGRSLSEAGRSLGHGTSSIFWRLALPYASPWLIGGVCLVALEVLNDFGTVSVIGVSTFTTGIYKAWFAFFSPETAAQLSSLLIALAFLIICWDQWARRRRNFNSRSLPPMRLRLRGPKAWAATFSAGLVVGLGFVIPTLQIMIWAMEHANDFLQPELRDSLLNSLALGGAAALLCCLGAVAVGFAKRGSTRSSVHGSYRIAQLGYGIPGTVIAVGTFLPMAWLDHRLVDWLEAHWSYTGGLILTGTMVSMSLALAIRYLAVSSSSLDAGWTRIPKSLDEAARLHGCQGTGLLARVHAPLLKGSFAAAFLLAFVDIIKEMPLTLMMRPFGWDTLSVRIYSFISEGEWQRASVPALVLILTGMAPLLLFAGKKS